MHEAEKLCDSILLINKGKTVLQGKLADIRSQYQSHAVSVELEGDRSFIEELPIVTKVVPQENRLKITLTENTDPQQLLKSLIDKVKVLAFEIKLPSLHEIFVSLVRASDEQDS